MAFAGMNYLAIVIAGIAGWLTGAIWYGILCDQWLAASGRTKREARKNKGKPAFYVPFVIAFIASLVMAWMLAGVVGHLGPGQVTIRNAMISAGFLWFGFVLTTISVNYAFGGRKLMLTVIDSGHWLTALLVMAAIIGAMGV